jgi:NADH-quinone oxidoreductase subunit N
VSYAVTNLGAFGVLALVASEDHPLDDVRDFAGLWHSRPGMAALLTVFLLSLGGIPPTAGFVAKWYIFSAAVGAGWVGLAIVGVLTSVVSVFFYLRVVVMMYMAEPGQPRTLEPIPTVSGAALVVSFILVLYLGVLPTRFISLAAASVSTLF